MMEQHTLEDMRNKFFVPRVANRRKRESPSADDPATRRAQKIVEEIKSSDRASQLPAEVREHVLEAFPEIQRLPS